MKGLAILLSIVTLTGGLQVLPVFAGKSEVKIDKSSYQEKLDTKEFVLKLVVQQIVQDLAFSEVTKVYMFK